MPFVIDSALLLSYRWFGSRSKHIGGRIAAQKLMVFGRNAAESSCRETNPLYIPQRSCSSFLNCLPLFSRAIQVHILEVAGVKSAIDLM